MMATESAQDGSNEAPVTSDPEPTIKIESDTQNVDSEAPHVNGDGASTATDEVENKQISDIVDDLVNSAEVSISGGSDTEASRPRLGHGDLGHGRTLSSVKKPTSFKAVSVNKTFLAAKGATSNSPAKVGEKSTAASGLASTAGTTSTAAARPRLVAKSGSGLVTKASGGLNGAKGSTPDPNAVWNKNRPVPVPEPKKLTDEELKKYGIHMATRLHPGDDKGQANWADIDDDDDDWAPETITWQDGTKFTIPHAEEHHPEPAAPAVPPTPAQEPVQHILGKENVGVEKPKSPAPGATTTVKPGLLASGKGLILKGVQEKPTLVAKPPAPPTPVKSPWAPIPKVDKAAPVVMELPASQQGAPKFGQKDVSAPKSGTPPPPKEIAADDFGRTPWRDGPGAPNRELFNAQSGRYEPVMDRRGSVRNDQHSRQPAALLQRSSQHDTQGPAEPSAAFQTSRVSEQHGPYGRRRGSSNVSGGSGTYIRLKGHELPLAPLELLTARRESFTAVSDSPVSPIRNFSPSTQHSGPRGQPHQNWQQPAHISPASTHSVPHHHVQPTEASLAPVLPPSAAPSAATVAPVITEQAFVSQKQLMQERREMAMKRRREEEEREEAQRRERIRLKLEAMGPAPESRSAKMAATKDEAPAAPQIQPRETGPPNLQETPVDEPKRLETTAIAPAEQETQPDSVPNGLPSQPQQPPTHPKASIEARSQQPEAAQVHPWPNTGPQPETYQTWGAAQVLNKNVWGSPNNDRSLGNGTFNPDLSRIPDAPLSAVPSKHVPGPIAPPGNTRGAPKPQPTVPSAPASRPAPIGPPRQTSHQDAPAPQRNTMASAWAAQVQNNDITLNKELLARREEQVRELQAKGLDVGDVQAPIKDTWRPTKVDDEGRRVNEKAKQAYHPTKAPGWGKPAEPASQPIQRQSSNTGQASSDFAQLPPVVTAPQQTKSSRFFPSRDVRQETALSGEDQQRSSPSPPPPDMAGHPAFDGDISHPHVSLPRPQPVVRLPPAPEVAPAPIAPPKQGPTFGWAAPTPYREHEAGAPPTGPAGQRRPSTSTHNPENKWQARIDSLLGGRKAATSPPKSVPVDSASRSSLEPPQYAQSATVSLPRGLFKNLPPDNDGSATSKDMAEECFEEQEMGSLPPVRMPKDVPEAAWHPCPAPKPMPKKLWALISSAEPLTFLTDMTGSGNVIRVLVPGMSETKNITVPFGRSRSNPRRQQRGGRHPSQQHRGGKGRDLSGPYSNEGMPSSSGPPPNRGRGSGGGYGRREWPRHSSSAPIST